MAAPSRSSSLAITRRGLLGLAAGSALLPITLLGASDASLWSYPLAFPGSLPGDDCFIKHGFACENLISYPGLLHTGENWYGLGRNAIEAEVIAASDGTVVYADFDYPGRVVILQHEGALFSAYGHLDPALAVEVGESVARGQTIGRPLSYPGDITRTHLHFEIRTFYLSDQINGEHPQHGFTCGYQCPPGPGYWPKNAPEHPADLGWLNPTHVIAGSSFPSKPAAGFAVQVAAGAVPTITAWSEPANHAGATAIGEIELQPGAQFPCDRIATGLANSHNRDATGYRLWYRIEHPDQGTLWVEALRPDDDAVDANGAPAAIRFDLVPAV